MESVYQFIGTAWVFWMMAVFFGIIFWALRPKNKGRFEDAGMIPFRDHLNGGAGHGGN